MYKIELRTPNLGISNFSFNRIVKSVYQLANCAFFAAYDKDYKDLSTIKQALKKDMDVTVLIDDELALTGYVAAVDCGYMNKKPSLSVKINTYAGRMVKASVGKGFYFAKQKAADIVSQLVSGYPVEFVNQSVNDVVLPAFAVSATDKIEKVLNRLARLSDTLIYSDDAGRLVMTDKCRDKYTASALITGENIIDISKNDNVYKAYETVTLHSQLPLADAYSLDNIISSPVSGKSQGSGRQYHQTVDIASQSRLNAAISELEYDCYDLKVTGSSFRTTDDKLYRLNSALKIKDPWIELNDSFLITDIDLTSGQNGCRAMLNLEKMA